ncbi:glucose-1-phosphate thymidylyltransferase RfbA [Prochlorococcus marinus]|uniref:glucose-1-phosphate thymidylyltransferase RfbA n=1 Tax=Prochlorococcus marinus TaxID=1219 RepID=UPI0022B4016A|nr:glucose-1-phosphate thymidylyltransferase RfbA [Prochlorococcus marinus]
MDFRYSSIRKGILVAGGKGRRLAPLTNVLSKQLMPVYDKPMIYYPITNLMLCGIKEILVVSDSMNMNLFKNLLGDGNQWGMKICYKIQKKPDGVANAISLGESFIDKSNVAVALGDNIFHGNDFVNLLRSADSISKGSTVLAYPVRDPKEYGVVKFDNSGNVIDIEEKPELPSSQYAITGIYFYDNTVFKRIKELEISSRGEMEVTDLNRKYLNDKLLNVKIMGRGMAWLDTGTINSLQEASFYVKTLEHRQGLKIGCPEEVAWRQGWIDDLQLEKLADSLSNSGYGKYLLKLLRTKYTR